MRITQITGKQSDKIWKDAPTKVIRGKLHGYQMRLDLSNWSQRMTYFLGRYYELHLAKLLDALLNPGDRFIDVGGNIGMITLHAARLVSPTGKIDCFEPNPDCIESITWHIEKNDISQVQIHRAGLSDAKDTATLHLTSKHTGTGTLANAHAQGSDVIKTYQVAVLVGDDEILKDALPPKVIKIDVEGFEYKVLRGLNSTLKSHRPYVITELIDAHLERAGTSILDVSIEMHALGYKAYGITISSHSVFQKNLQLIPLPEQFTSSKFPDVLWVHNTKNVPKSAHLNRLPH